MKILLVGKYPQGTQEILQEALQGVEAEVIAAATQEEFDREHDCDAIILRGPKMPEAVLKRFAPRLKLVMRWGAGYDGVDVKAARSMGIDVCNTPGANAHAVAELTLGMMLSVARKLACHKESLKAGVLSKSLYENQSFTLKNKIVGIVGGGNIGRQVATRVQAFGAKTIYYDVFRLKPEMEKEFNLEFVKLETLFKTAQIITLHVPLTEDNHNMINAKTIALMQDGAVVINAARGGLVDEAALLSAVESGKLKGAGIDCLVSEEKVGANPLLTNPNIYVTPHIGGSVGDIGESIIPMIVENMQALAKGEALKYVVNKEV